MAVLNSTLLDNLSMHNQPNSKALWAYLWTLIETSVSSSQTVDLVFSLFYFLFLFSFHFIFYFLFLEQLGLGLIGHTVTLVTT